MDATPTQPAGQAQHPPLHHTITDDAGRTYVHVGGGRYVLQPTVPRVEAGDALVRAF